MKSISPTEMAKKDTYSQKILNLEFLEYYANKLSSIYHIKDYVIFFPEMKKKM